MVLGVGEEKTVRLPSLSSAGYEWSVQAVDGDGEAVAVRELDPDTPQTPPGESPDHVFGLSARHPGGVTLRFEQRRPWEDTPPRETRELKITVSA